MISPADSLDNVPADSWMHSLVSDPNPQAVKYAAWQVIEFAEHYAGLCVKNELLKASTKDDELDSLRAENERLKSFLDA